MATVDLTDVEKALRDPAVLQQSAEFYFRLNNRMPSDPSYAYMHYIRTVYGFAWITAEAINATRKTVPILEVGSGSGYVASEFMRRGRPVIATDPGVSHHQTYGERKFTAVAKMTGIEAIEQAERAGHVFDLMMCWPSYDEDWTGDTLAAYTGYCIRLPPQARRQRRVYYMGEGRSGCTANDRFHEILEAEWKLKEWFQPADLIIGGFPQGTGMSDSFQVYTWNGTLAKSRADQPIP